MNTPPLESLTMTMIISMTMIMKIMIMMNNEPVSFRVVDKAQRRALQLPDLGKVVIFSDDIQIF